MFVLLLLKYTKRNCHFIIISQPATTENIRNSSRMCEWYCKSLTSSSFNVIICFVSHLMSCSQCCQCNVKMHLFVDILCLFCLGVCVYIWEHQRGTLIEMRLSWHSIRQLQLDNTFMIWNNRKRPYLSLSLWMRTRTIEHQYIYIYVCLCEYEYSEYYKKNGWFFFVSLSYGKMRVNVKQTGSLIATTNWKHDKNMKLTNT